MASHDPITEIDPVAASIVAAGDGGFRLLIAFQALACPPGRRLSAKISRKHAARVVNEALGVECVTNRSRVPPRETWPEGADAMAVYLTWAMREGKRRHPGMTWSVAEAG